MAQTTFDICTECGEKTEVTIIDEVTRLCEDCIDELDYVKCDKCNEYYLYDAIDWYELENGDTVCEYCNEDIE